MNSSPSHPFPPCVVVFKKYFRLRTLQFHRYCFRLRNGIFGLSPNKSGTAVPRIWTVISPFESAPMPARKSSDDLTVTGTDISFIPGFISVSPALTMADSDPVATLLVVEIKYHRSDCNADWIRVVDIQRYVQDDFLREADVTATSFTSIWGSFTSELQPVIRATAAMRTKNV